MRSRIFFSFFGRRLLHSANSFEDETGKKHEGLSGQGAGVRGGGWGNGGRVVFIMSFSSLLPKLKGRRREDEFNSHCPAQGALRTSSRTNCPV